MSNALQKMINEIQQIRNADGTGGVGNVSQAEANAFRAAQQEINNLRYTGGVGNVSNQEKRMLNNVPTGGSSVGNMSESDVEYIRANNPVVGAFGDVSDRETQMFNAMANGAGNNFTSPIEEMRALQQKGASGAGFLSDVEINRFMQLRNQLNPNLPQEKPLATVLEPVDIDGAGQMSLQELTRLLENSKRLGRSGY